MSEDKNKSGVETKEDKINNAKAFDAKQDLLTRKRFNEKFFEILSGIFEIMYFIAAFGIAIKQSVECGYIMLLTSFLMLLANGVLYRIEKKRKRRLIYFTENGIGFSRCIIQFLDYDLELRDFYDCIKEILRDKPELLEGLSFGEDPRFIELFYKGNTPDNLKRMVKLVRCIFEDARVVNQEAFDEIVNMDVWNAMKSLRDEIYL